LSKATRTGIVQRVTPHIHVLRPVDRLSSSARQSFKFAPSELSRPLGHLSETFLRSPKIAGQRRFDWNSSSALLRTSCAQSHSLRSAGSGAFYQPN